MTTARVRPHVTRVLEQARAVLLDSSALCSLVSAGQASLIAEAIRNQILARGHKMSILVHLTDDPLSMLAYAHSLGPADGADAEQILRAAELSAAATTSITPDARAVIDACRVSGRRVAVMSVHCAEAVESVLGLSGLRQSVGPVIGRGHLCVTTQNFHADQIRVAAQEVGAESASCAVVGLSVAAVCAARDTDARGIGVVNTHASRKHLAAFGAAVLPSLAALAAALRSVPPAGSSPPS
jgi:beta-phosphoglucomutase-like phosphatase (HAD superfamily)